MTLFYFSQYTVVNDKYTVDFPLPNKRMSVKNPFEQSFAAWTEKKTRHWNFKVQFILIHCNTNEIKRKWIFFVPVDFFYLKMVLINDHELWNWYEKVFLHVFIIL